MTIGNKPKEEDALVDGKRYWWLSIGRNTITSRYFDNGWRAFEFVVLEPYHKPYKQIDGTQKILVRFAFAYWLPIYFL